jgi:hypothetical protein
MFNKLSQLSSLYDVTKCIASQASERSFCCIYVEKKLQIYVVYVDKHIESNIYKGPSYYTTFA